MGTNRGATQAGMTFGGVRHVGDLRVDQMDQDSQNAISLQYGKPGGANQSGMSYGGRRDISGQQY